MEASDILKDPSRGTDACGRLETLDRPKTFDLADQPRVQGIEVQGKQVGRAYLSCEYNFVNLFCWAPVYDYSWFFYQDRLVIHDGKDEIMFMPMGSPMTPESLRALSAKALDMGMSPDICLVPEAYLDRFPDIHQYYKAEPDRDAGEYIYRTKKLAALTGTKLHKKRNLISQFKRRYPDYRVEPLTGDQLPLAQGFAGELLARMDDPPETLLGEFQAMKRAFGHWDALGLDGIIIRVSDRVAAFCVFSPNGENTYNVHFEKTDMALKGAAQLINRETAIHLQETAEFINREQDLGIKGLRQAKLSYEPYRIWVPWVLRYTP